MATDIIVGQLLENAVKYSPSGGKVTVRARSTDDKIEVEVADEGIGITPERPRAHLRALLQGETGDRRRFGGVGIGLYIVRQLAWRVAARRAGARWRHDHPLPRAAGTTMPS